MSAILYRDKKKGWSSLMQTDNKMMTAEYPEQSECTLQGIKCYASYGARDVLILVSSAPEGGDVIARKNGELTKQDKQRLTSEGIPEDHWEDDAMMMKERYLKDREYKLVNVEDCHQMKKQYVLDKMISFFNNTTMPGGEKNKCMSCKNDLYLAASIYLCSCVFGQAKLSISLLIVLYFLVILHCIGPGRRATGDWCFCDGYISFREIADLYTKHFTGRTLYIISDCSYSGKWVESCKEFLDEVGVQPCGHSAQKKGIKLKVWCSCQPEQIGSSLIYSARGNGNDKNTGSKYVSNGYLIAPDQTTCGVDFTKLTCGKTPEEECALVPTFTFQLKKTLLSRLFRVRGKDRGRPVWHIVLLVDDPVTIRIFKEKTQGENARTQTIKMDDYGEAIKSGLGQNPPQEVVDWIDRVQNGLETFSL